MIRIACTTGTGPGSTGRQADAERALSPTRRSPVHGDRRSIAPHATHRYHRPIHSLEHMF